MPLRTWRPQLHAFVKSVILRNLEGVGVADERHEETGEMALHIRRPLTPEEEAGIADERKRRTGCDAK